MTHRGWKIVGIFVGLALPGLAQEAIGQKLIRPGDASFTTDHLTPFEARYVQTMGGQAGNGMERVHRLESVRVAGQPAWRHSVLMLGQGMVEDEITTQHDGGRPLLRRITAPSLLHRVEVWEGATIHGVTVAKDGKSSETYEIPADAARFGGLQASVLVGLPLEDRREVFLAAVNSDLGAPNADMVARVRVLGGDQIETPAGKFVARKVQVDIFGPAAGSEKPHGEPLGVPSQALWLIERAPYLVRSEMQTPGGATMTLELASIAAR